MPGTDDQLRFERLARETGAALVVGAVGLEFGPGATLVGVTDSAFVFEASGELVHRYDKTHLVPFGEYVPLQDLLGRCVPGRRARHRRDRRDRGRAPARPRVRGSGRRGRADRRSADLL